MQEKLTAYFIENKGYSDSLAYIMSLIICGMISRSPHRSKQIIEVIQNTHIWCGDALAITDDRVRNVFEQTPARGLYDPIPILNTLDLDNIDLDSIENYIYLNFDFDPSDILNIRTLAHELGHAINTKTLLDKKKHIMTEFCGCSPTIYKLLLPPQEGIVYKDCISCDAYGLREALNSLHTNDLLKSVFGKGTKLSYAVMTEVLSQFRELYGLEQELLLAEETNDLDLLKQTITRKASPKKLIKLYKREPADVLIEYCDKIADIYWMKDRNDHISVAQKLTDEVTTYFGLNKKFERIVVAELLPPDDTSFGAFQPIAMTDKRENLMTQRRGR